MGNPRKNSLLSERSKGREMEEDGETQDECNFWESELNLIKKCSKVHGRSVSYYGKRHIPNFLFFHWVRNWISILSDTYLDPYKLHPLPPADQILYWQPIFSKHVSDSLIELERDEVKKVRESGGSGRIYRCRKLILLRAILYTFWRRILLATIGMIAMNIFSMSIAILLSKLFKLMTSEEFNYLPILGLILVIIILELSKGICIDHVIFYVQRLIVMLDYSLGITVFHHGLCLRRGYGWSTRIMEGMEMCGEVMHRCEVGSRCAQNPLFCPALRHKNLDINPKMYSYKFVDCYYVTLVFDNLTDVVNFLTNFIYGIILIHYQMKIRIWSVFIISIFLVLFMISVEILNSYLLKFYYALRDHRISKSFEVITNFKLIRTLAMEDLAENMITDVRNDELGLVVYRFFLSLVNKILYSIIVTCALLIIINDFVNQLKNTTDLKMIDASSIITLLFILLKIIDPMFMLPLTLRLLILVINSYNRLEYFIRTCSPNYYQTDKFLVDDVVRSKLRTNKTVDMERGRGEGLRLREMLKSRSSDGKGLGLGNYVVKLENASFSWIFSRGDLLLETSVGLLEKLDFELRRGEVAVVTGGQGSGKTNFLKALLGEMTLVGGSMYVKPLNRSLPIFYASHEVWLRRGTIRSNIIFGHIFEEILYKCVVRAVELETDISTWENGDMRVISDGGFELSGGQRVRIELGRALYSYLVYNKVARDYSSGTSSFLMCLDCIFLGLDPYVSRRIFHNLFNTKTGLLANPLLAVVLTTSKRSLDTCVASVDVEEFPNIPIYTITNKRLVLRSDLRRFVKGKELVQDGDGVGGVVVEKNVEDVEPVDDPTPHRSLSTIYKKCKSKDFERISRRMVVRDQYDDKSGYGSHKMSGKGSFKSISLEPLLTYMNSAGASFFIFFILLIFYTTLDNMRYIFASKLSNFVNDNIKNLSTFIDDKAQCESVHSLIKENSTKSLTLITYLSMFVIILCISVVISMTFVSFKASLNIHEYSLDSALYQPSSKVKIKRYISDVITFLSCDTLYIDLALGYYLFDSLILIVETIIHMIMLIYLLPTSVVFVILAMILIIRFPMLWFIKALSNIRFAYMTSTNRLNCVFNDCISGSLAYRCYRKEGELVSEFVEHADYNSRCRFMEKATHTWASVTCRCIFSFMIFFIILTPITVSKVVEYDIKIGYYGLAFSLCLNVTNRFSKLLRIFTKLQLYLCSVIRFKNFVPHDEKLKFKTPKDIYIEDVVVGTREKGVGEVVSEEFDSQHHYMFTGTSDFPHSGVDVMKLRNKYLTRRKDEFYEVRKKVSIRSLFFKPKINIVDVMDFLPSSHKSIKLENVYVMCSSSNSLMQDIQEVPSNDEEIELESIKVSDGEGDEDEEGDIITSHPRSKRVLLRDINQQASRSDIIGIIGRTGAGKTTLLSVLLNIAKARKGDVLLDGKDLNELPKSVLRNIIGVLPQLPFVFRGWTVRRFLDPRRLFSDNEINRALSDCGLLEFVNNLPGSMGLDTIILPEYYHKDMPKYLKRVYYKNLFNNQFSHLKLGKKFSRLSTLMNTTMDADLILSNTHMRTLTFARLMLYRHLYRMILIDEPPSDNCDEVGTMVQDIGIPIYQLLSQYFQHCTCFIAAHDVNALRSCTKLWILNNGNLVMTCDTEQILQDESLSKLIQECTET